MIEEKDEEFGQMSLVVWVVIANAVFYATIVYALAAK